MPITDKEDELVWKTGLGKELSPYNLFSVFLQWEILKSDDLDIACIPNEYIDYMASLYDCAEDSGDLILVTMLFTEHFQKQQTGNFKLVLSDEKYKQLGLQFALFCKLEILRRQNIIESVKARYLFDPNVKTEFKVAPTSEPVKELLLILTKLGVRVT